VPVASDPHPHSLPIPSCLRYTTPRTNRFSRFTLGSVLRVALINRQVVLALTQRLLHTLPILHLLEPLSPSLPHLVVVTTFALFRQSRSALEVIENPQSIGPWRDGNVDETKLLAHEERALGMHLLDKLGEFADKVVLFFLQSIFALVLQKSVVGGDDAAANKVSPDAGPRSVVWILWYEMRRLVGKRLFEKLA
jgi:hypothetical protein